MSALFLLGMSAARAAAGDFADAVVEYRPAPGQFINQASQQTGLLFCDPAAALGAPIGGGTSAPNNDKLVTLGGFGGSITLGFAQTVLDGPCNPFGLDAIVFGNAFGSQTEPGVIEISLDANNNGLPDDAWYVIPGTMLPPAPAPPDDASSTQLWDNDPGSPTPPEPQNIAAWYPDAAKYPLIVPPGPSSYSTSGWDIPIGPTSGAVGHADVSPVLILGDLDGDNIVDDPLLDAEDFYTVADNPWAPGTTSGSGGGDAFDIAWAVDPATGERANLPGFDFIRISTGFNGTQGPLGEYSTEIGGVAEARPDPLFFDADASGAVDPNDLYQWHASPSDLSGDAVIDEADRVLIARCARSGETTDMVGGP